MRWIALVVVAGLLAAAPRAARADDGGAVALLPLDADRSLELYGQPVASEVARALVAGGIDVVVVGPKMGVPERARLIVDGKISTGKGDTVVLSLRIRDRDTGTVLDTLSADAAALTSIDRAAADLSARALPTVRARLAARVAKPQLPADSTRPRPPPAAPAALQPLAIAISMDPAAAGGDVLRVALTDAAGVWARARHREPRPLAPQQLTAAFAAASLAKEHLPAGLALEIVAYTVEPGAIPMARARVRMRLADATHILVDRVVVTDTIVGDRELPPARLAERVAREVLAIASPTLVRQMPELAP